ncbi:MAG TPA: ROK family protein [Candidatus Obscuribacterales bacterium]
MQYAIGIDLGGTNIKAIAVNREGMILGQASRETGDRGGNAPQWPQHVATVIGELSSRFPKAPTHIGLCAPGLAATDGRSIAFMPGRMDGLEGLDWTKFLGVNNVVSVLNDAHAALLGEVWRGAARGANNVVLLTLGTGVGGAILADGRLLKGQIGRAGHLGHMCLEVNGLVDSVGIPGSLEDAVAERSVSRRSDGAFKSTKALVDAAADGDTNARAIWQRSIYQLACGIASLINAVDPEVVVIGGGIAKAGDRLFQPLRNHLDKLEWRPGGHSVLVVPAKLGELAGAYGAAYNAIQTNKASVSAGMGAFSVPNPAAIT